MTIKTALNNTVDRLRAAGIETCRLDAELLVCEAVKCSRIHLITRDDTSLTLQQEADLEAMTLRRLKYEPMQYILGHCEFMGLDFRVTGNTLIPRGDTECLVEHVLDYIKKNNTKTVLDIGTGSGAIIVSLAYYGKIIGTAVDISEGALKVAEENALSNGVKNQISFIKSDLFENLDTKFDVIVSNPPYIERDVIPTLGSNVKDYEPVGALDGGVDGLDFYRAISTAAPGYLNSNGLIAFEIGYNQAEAVKNILVKAGFTDIEIARDLSGLDRVVCARLK